jgi:tetratricopeptide (TPR) repeat protein
VTLDSLVSEFEAAGWLDANAWGAAALESPEAAPTVRGTPGGTAVPGFDAIGGVGRKIGRDVGNTVRGMIAKLREDHPSAAERREMLAEYIGREYAGIDVPARVDSWWDARSVAETREILRNYDNAFQASRFYQRGASDRAQQLSDQSVTGLTRDHAYPLYQRALLFEQRGEVDAALASLGAAFEAPEPALAVYTHAAKLHQRRGDHEQAVVVLEQARARLGSPPSLLPRLIVAYRLAGRNEEAARLRMECQTVEAQYAQACAEADGAL